MAKTNDKQLEELVEKAKEGNREAFSEIMQITMNKTLALTYKYTQDMESAKDMTQETYIAIWEHIKDFKGEAKFESWLYRIASNKCLNYLKKVKRVSFNNEMEQQPVDNPEKQLITKELKEETLYFMSQLPSQQRIVFELRFYKELKFDEIAKITQKAVGTVKTLYREAVIKLRRHAKKKGWHQ